MCPEHSSSSDSRIAHCGAAIYQPVWAVAELLCLHFLIFRKGIMSPRDHEELRRISSVEITPANKYGALRMGQACVKCFANSLNLIKWGLGQSRCSPGTL